jgi:hypothetical protein
VLKRLASFFNGGSLAPPRIASITHSGLELRFQTKKRHVRRKPHTSPVKRTKLEDELKILPLRGLASVRLRYKVVADQRKLEKGRLAGLRIRCVSGFVANT